MNLLERGYEVYTSITSNSFVIARDKMYGSCLIIPATKSSDGRLIADLRQRKTERKTFAHTSYTYVIVIDPESKELWLIPTNDIAQHSTVTLSKSKEHYIITSLKNEEINLIKNVRLKEEVQEVAAKVNEVTFAKLSEQDQRNEIHNILNRE